MLYLKNFWKDIKLLKKSDSPSLDLNLQPFCS